MGINDPVYDCPECDKADDEAVSCSKCFILPVDDACINHRCPEHGVPGSQSVKATKAPRGDMDFLDAETERLLEESKQLPTKIITVKEAVIKNCGPVFAEFLYLYPNRKLFEVSDMEMIARIAYEGEGLLR